MWRGGGGAQRSRQNIVVPVSTSSVGRLMTICNSEAQQLQELPTQTIHQTINLVFSQ